MKNIIIHIALILATFTMYDCSDNNCVSTAGKDAQKTIQLTPFRTLEVHGIFTIELIPDTVDFVSIRSGKNMIEQSEFLIQDSTLFCYNNSECSFFKNFEKVQLQIHTTSLDSITIYNACNISNTVAITRNLVISQQAEMVDLHLNLNNNYCKLSTLNVAGGSIVFTGKCKRCNFSAQYTTLLDSRNLKVSNMIIKNNTINDFYIQITDSLQVEIYKTGKIYYTGNPIYVNDSKANGLLIKRTFELK